MLIYFLNFFVLNVAFVVKIYVDDELMKLEIKKNSKTAPNPFASIRFFSSLSCRLYTNYQALNP